MAVLSPAIVSITIMMVITIFTWSVDRSVSDDLVDGRKFGNMPIGLGVGLWVGRRSLHLVLCSPHGPSPFPKGGEVSV